VRTKGEKNFEKRVKEGLENVKMEAIKRRRNGQSKEWNIQRKMIAVKCSG